jgi:hypothetical protein
MKTKNTLRFAVCAAIMAVLLAGCVEAPATGEDTLTSTAPIPAHTESQTGQSWGEAVPENGLADTPSGHVYVDRDGPDSAGSYFWSESANDPAKPGEIVGPGLHLKFHVAFQSVPRAITDAYVATDPEGKNRGPALDCFPGQYIPPGEFDPVYDPDSFDCIAAFVDPAYESGTYYGVVVSEPTSRDQANYGTKTTILPAYTSITDIATGDVTTG